MLSASKHRQTQLILVLLNMVMDEDLATAEDAKMLEEEVGEEVSKFGKLLSLKIPKPGVSTVSFYSQFMPLTASYNVLFAHDCLSFLASNYAGWV